MFSCDICEKNFSAKRSMVRHRNGHHVKLDFRCDGCGRHLHRKEDLNRHMKTCKFIPTVDDTFVEVETAVKKRVKTYSADPKHLVGDIPTVLSTLKTKIIERIAANLMIYTSLKFNLFLECEFSNPTGETCLMNFKTRNTIVYKSSNVGNILTIAFNKLYAEKSECQNKGSGWSFKRFIRLEIRINKYNPLRGSTFIPLPDNIINKKCVINVQNYDQYCFKYAILSKYVSKNPQNVSKYSNNSELDQKYDWSCLTFPVKFDSIAEFEIRNNISINVFGLDEKQKVCPLKVCDKELDDHRDLLYITNEKTAHYCYITDFARLVRNQKTKSQHRILICKRCFYHFDDRYGTTAEEKLAEHKIGCMKHDAVRHEFPSYDKINFKNHNRSKKVRFVIYADFETLLQPISFCPGNPNTSWSSAYQEHLPYSYCYLVKDSEDEHTVLRQYRGDDAAKHFMMSVAEDVKNIDKILYGDKKLDVPVLTPEQQLEFDQTMMCHICKKGDFTETNYKVRNHCHVSGVYLGVAHRHCNLFYQDQHFIPCFIHNLSGFDSHFIIRELGYDTSTINVIPNTAEKYVSFSKFIGVEHARHNHLELRFLDSFRFMASSLSTLADNLPDMHFIETMKTFPTTFNLMKKKGVFPFEYVSSMNMLDATELPPRSLFYSSLTDEEITEEMYKHAQNVWSQSNVKTLGEYSDLYVTSDVVILCDVFENFRKMCMDTYDLDPAYYFTAPGLSWDAMLKYTNIELEVLKDLDMVIMLEKGIRGGITQCVKRYSIANNKHLPETFDSNLPNTYLLYVDATNLYGYAMTKNLPYGGFQWVDVDPAHILTLPEDSEEGYILEVDLEYPRDIHDQHSDFPFCTEMKIPPGGLYQKLLPSVEDKERYVIHYVALQQAVSHGLKLKKIHRAIKFDQKPWLKTYIDLNTEKRKAATNVFEKDFFKLMCNSVFGKTMENVRKRKDIRLVSDPMKLEKLISKSNFIDRTIISEDLVAVHMQRTSIVFSKPIYLGMTILDLSKVHMYSFHYDVMQPFYKHRLELAYNDTDSFIYELKSEDMYEELKAQKDHLDTSNYPVNHPLHSTNNKGVLGKFKDEVAGEVIQGFVGLRSKMYAIKKKGSVIRKIKGIRRSAITRKIHFGTYVKCLFKGRPTYSLNNTFVSKKHEVKTVMTNKVTLNRDDDKRYIMKDNIHTLPHGHWRISAEKDETPPIKRVKLS